MPTSLTKGQNAPLTTDRVLVSVQLPAPADLSALLVAANGKVRSDADFVFYNQPQGPGVRLVPGAAGQPASLEVDLAAVPQDVDQVRAVITLDDGSSSFGRFPAPTAIVADGAGNALFDYVIDGLASESVVIALELYRRAGAWKVRAVGQGYAGGFAELVTDHGVQLDGGSAAPAAPAPAQPQQAAPVPAPQVPPYTTPNDPQHASTFGGAQAPAPSPQQAPAFGGQQAPAPGQAPAYDPQQAPAFGGRPPAQQPPAYGQPPQAPAAQAAPAPAYGQPQQAPAPGFGQGAPAAAPAEPTLQSNRPVSLAKGQGVTLRKEGGVALEYVRMGLGWDPIQRRGLFGNREIDVDLDASAFMFAGPSIVDVAYYGQLISKDGSIRHSGDNLTGDGDGDDEIIHVDLTRVPPHVDQILFIVTSYKQHTFEQIANAFCRLVDGTTNAELARFTLQGGMPFTAMAMAKVVRSGSDWKMQAIGEGFNARHPGEAAPQLARFVS
ncbi:stress protein [Pseudoclavibacter chungangensis]|uniref:Stress protein n=1 Tax=Pseudoclavibacter chungangensis TaxID=587635 RepID=A0A7J5BUG7_9MICO|nr:TerD family protein [Pseudoclavibacter chungangensis]KAB1657975.1 stress protein [Pseudoclavibacter chungangensis]NYJ65869.1 stress response protein SCP2 [Pseudoclavibacter chungangensis]